MTSLARPGGNVTGLSNMIADLTLKRLGLLREAVPGARRIALLHHPDEPIVKPQPRDLEHVGRAQGLQFKLLGVRTAEDLQRAFAEAGQWRADAVLRLAGQASTLGRQTAELAQRWRLPAMLFTARDVEAGALMSYYVDDDAAFRRVAEYVHRLLQGAPPGDLPIEQPTRYELAVNVKTARTLGLTLSPTLLLRADRVIE